MAARWRALLEAGSLEPREDFFWAQPTPFQDMPERIRRDLAGSALVFVKGDANYRRLLDERAWPLDTPFADVASGWPAPVCALRTLKAELGCGMSPGRVSCESESLESISTSSCFSFASNTIGSEPRMNCPSLSFKLSQK